MKSIVDLELKNWGVMFFPESGKYMCAIYWTEAGKKWYEEGVRKEETRKTFKSFDEAMEWINTEIAK